MASWLTVGGGKNHSDLPPRILCRLRYTHTTFVRIRDSDRVYHSNCLEIEDYSQVTTSYVTRLASITWITSVRHIRLSTGYRKWYWIVNRVLNNEAELGACNATDTVLFRVYPPRMTSFSKLNYYLLSWFLEDYTFTIRCGKCNDRARWTVEIFGHGAWIIWTNLLCQFSFIVINYSYFTTERMSSAKNCSPRFYRRLKTVPEIKEDCLIATWNVFLFDNFNRGEQQLIKIEIISYNDQRVTDAWPTRVILTWVYNLYVKMER